MTFTIRPPRPDEAEVLADLHLRTWAETYAGQFPPSAWGEDARTQRVRMWTAICTDPRPDWRTAVAEADGHPIGIAHSADDRDDPAHLPRQLWLIYVLQSSQGSGAGQALLDAVLGVEPASLWVLEDNPRARAFYVRNGFTPDGARQPTGFEAGGDEIRLVR